MNEKVQDYDLKFKIFSKFYYPLQYLLVRTLIFGLVIQPTIIDLYRGFNITAITKVIFDFVGNLPEVLQAEHYLFIILNFIPYLIRLLWELRYIILYAYSLFCIMTFVLASLKNIDYNNTYKNECRVKTYIGGPGAGKTSKMFYDAVLTARYMWNELRIMYHTMKNFVKDWKKEKNTLMLNKWYEVKDSYEYWITTDCIPCLMSNVPVEINGQYSTVLTWEHAYQKKRVPYYCVLAFDESGGTFLVDDYRDKPLEVSDFFRAERHFGDWYIFLTEQDSSNQFIDVRRVVGFNLYMLGQKTVLKPLELVLIYNLIRVLILTFDRCSKRLARFMIWLKKVISFIGFRKYRCVKEANTERSGIYEKIRVKTVYLTTYLNCNYDDRALKDFYKAKDLPLELEVHKSLRLPVTEETETAFLRNAQEERQEAEKEVLANESLALADKVLNNADLKTTVKLYLAELDERKKLAKKILDNKEIKNYIKSA